MVEQKPTTINIDLRLQSGQQALAEFANATSNPLPIASHNNSGTKDVTDEKQINSSKRASSILVPTSKPAYPGAKHDVRGFCIWHPRCRLVRALDGSDGGEEGDPSHYRVVRKICHSCGEQALVKKERKPTSHGFNPYNHQGDKNDRRDSTDNGRLFTKVVPRSKSMSAKSPHFRKRHIDGTASDEKLKSSDNERPPKSTNEKQKSTEKLNTNNNNLRSSTEVEAPLPAKDSGVKREKKDEIFQRQKSQSNHKPKDEKHDRKEVLHRQKSQVAGHHDRKEDLHKSKGQSTTRPKEELLQRQKSQSDHRDEGLQRQKSHNEKERQDSYRKEKGRHAMKSYARAKSKAEELKDGGSSNQEQKNDRYPNALQQNERRAKNRSKSEDHPDPKIERKTSVSNSQQVPATNSHEEAPSVNVSKGSGNKNYQKHEPQIETESKRHGRPSISKQVGPKLFESSGNVEKKASADMHENKRVIFCRQRSERSRHRSLSPPRQIIQENIIPKDDKKDAQKSLKERSKSVGHQRQRLAPEFHYVHQKPVSHVPSSTLSTYRSQFYTDVMAQSCLQSLMDKNLKI